VTIDWYKKEKKSKTLKAKCLKILNRSTKYKNNTKKHGKRTKN